MPRDAVPPASEPRLPFTNPWPLLGGALGTAIVVMFLHAAAPQAVALRGLLIVAAIVAALGGVGVRLRSVREDADNRFRTAGIIALAAAVPFICRLSIDAKWESEWDSVGLLLDVMFGVGLACAGLLLLPRLVRRLTLVVLVVIHFGGILSAVGSPAPPGGQPSWLIQQLWIGIYRPYLHFMYLNNAYHFYSPNPGPPSLLWFRIEYEGGKSRWVEIPSLGEAKSKLAFQRGLALGESTNQLKQQAPYDFDERWRLRLEAGENFKNGLRIPPLNDPKYGHYFEYREPTAHSKRLLESYARHVLASYPYINEQHEEDPSLRPLKVKIYRVIHAIPETKYIADGGSPFFEITYLPYYQGEFDTEGRLLDGQVFRNCVLVSRGDPFLYWLIPIKLEPRAGYVQKYDSFGRPIPPTKEEVHLVDYLKVHAGDTESIWDIKPK